MIVSDAVVAALVVSLKGRALPQRIDGADIRRFRQRSLRQQISFVLQETMLFHAPVWQNIAYGKPDASHREIIRAAELANAAEFIDKLLSEIRDSRSPERKTPVAISNEEAFIAWLQRLSRSRLFGRVHSHRNAQIAIEISRVAKVNRVNGS